MMILRMKYFFLIILTFLFIYNIPFVFLPFGTAKFFSAFSIIFLSVFLLRNRLPLIKHREILVIFILIMFLSIYSVIIVACVHATYDFSIAYAYLLFIFEHLLGSIPILYLMRRMEILSIDNVLKLIVNVIFIQSIFILLMIIFPNFKEFSFEILRGNRVELAERYGGFRGLGFASSTTYDLAVVQSLGLMFIALKLSQTMKRKTIMVGIIMFIFILFSILVSGRTGWIGIFFSVSIVFLNVIYMKNLEYIKRFIKNLGTTMFFLMPIIIIFCSVYYFFLRENLGDLLNNYIIPFAFELFINIFEKGEFETSSSNVLREMYFGVPLNSFLWGDGYYVNPYDEESYYMNTDAGFMRHLLYYGIFGSLGLYCLYMYIFYTLFHKIKILKGKIYPILTLMLFIYYFTAHIKGDFLLGANMAIKILLLIYITVLVEYKQYRNDS